MKIGAPVTICLDDDPVHGYVHGVGRDDGVEVVLVRTAQHLIVAERWMVAERPWHQGPRRRYRRRVERTV